MFSIKILNKKTLPFVKILWGIVCLIALHLIAISLIISAILAFFTLQDQAREARIRKEIAKMPGVTVISVKVNEMEDVIKIDIKNKGSLTYRYYSLGLYGVKPLIQIIEIGPYKPLFACWHIDSDRTLSSQSNVGLFFGKPSYFYKWFPFEVKNVQDLVTHYDDIVNTLETFPSSHAMNPIYDTNQWKKEKIVEKFNPDFVSHTIRKDGLETYCDMSMSDAP